MSPKSVLVFGGNGFIGTHTVLALLDSPSSHCDIVLLNRGKSWEWSVKDQILSKVKHTFIYDRKKTLERCEKFVQWLNEVKTVDFVLDFSGYQSDYLRNSLETLSGRVGLYIYISSDSVYEVCYKTHSGLTCETDDIRPQDLEQCRMLRRNDSYGYKKWQCEQLLQQEGSMKYLILRLSDVVGPRDSTDRWWQYQLWLAAASQCGLPVYVPDNIKDKEISVVAVEDVANLLVGLISGNHGNITSAQVQNNTFNISCKQVVTVKELLLKMAASMKCDDCDIRYHVRPDIPQIYPSIDKGPIDISKAVSMLGWEPSSLQDVIDRTVQFYQDLLTTDHHHDQKVNIFTSLTEDLSDVYEEAEYCRIKDQLCKILHIHKP